MTTKRKKVDPARDPRIWSPEENAWLLVHWKPFSTAAEEKRFMAAYEKQFGKTRTRKAMEIQAHKLGTTRAEGMEMPTVAEVARELGISKDRLNDLVLRNPEKYPTIKQGVYRFVPEKTYLVLCERYRIFTEEDLRLTVTTEEAADRLCYTVGAINRLLQYNALRHIRRGKVYRIYRDSLEEAFHLRELHGKDWLTVIAHRLSDRYREVRARAVRYYARSQQRLTSAG